MSGQAAYLEDDFEARAQYAADLLDGKPLTDVDPQARKPGSPKRHGHSWNDQGLRSPTYISWQGMKSRCHAVTDPHYQVYGATGVSVCDRWRYSFESFLADMGPRPTGKTIDRIDCDGNYEPSNCRWATPQEQTDNRRVGGNRTPRWYEHNGERRTIAGWARFIGLSHTQLCRRLDSGLSIELALAPPRKHQTHCLRGHPLSGDNLYEHKSGGYVRRNCRACGVIRQAKSRLNTYLIARDNDENDCLPDGLPVNYVECPTRYLRDCRLLSTLTCPDCGASLQPNARLDALRCPGCGFTQDIDQESM